MRPIQFEGSKEVKKPENMTDEQCSSIWADCGIDAEGFPYVVTAWMPNYEDIKAINDGRPIFIKTLGRGISPMSLFTLDEEGDVNC